MVGVSDQQPGRRVAEDIGDLRRCQAPVKRREQCPDPRAGEEERQHRGAVEAEERDPVAAPDAMNGFQRPRMAADFLGEAGVVDVLGPRSGAQFSRV